MFHGTLFHGGWQDGRPRDRHGPGNLFHRGMFHDKLHTVGRPGGLGLRSNVAD